MNIEEWRGTNRRGWREKKVGDRDRSKTLNGQDEIWRVGKRI